MSYPEDALVAGENPLLRAPLSRRRFLALGGGLAATATLGAACSAQAPQQPHREWGRTPRP